MRNAYKQILRHLRHTKYAIQPRLDIGNWINMYCPELNNDEKETLLNRLINNVYANECLLQARKETIEFYNYKVLTRHHRIKHPISFDYQFGGI